MDWLKFTIANQLVDIFGVSTTGGKPCGDLADKIAAAIREEIRKRKPKPREEKIHAGYEFSLTGREYNEALAEYDKALGLEEGND